MLKSKALLKVLKWLARPSAQFSAHVVRYDSVPGGGGVAGGSPVLISDWGSPAILSGSWKKGKTKDGESGSTVVARTPLQS